MSSARLLIVATPVLSSVREIPYKSAMPSHITWPRVQLILSMDWWLSDKMSWKLLWFSPINTSAAWAQRSLVQTKSLSPGRKSPALLQVYSVHSSTTFLNWQLSQHLEHSFPGIWNLSTSPDTATLSCWIAVGSCICAVSAMYKAYSHSWRVKSYSVILLFCHSVILYSTFNRHPL